jgi:RND family efflux transporter MFP subunit
MLVEERTAVCRGELIAELEAGEQKAAVAEAQGRLAEIETDITLAESRLKRILKMAANGGASDDEIERRQHELDSARARRETAIATLARLNEALAKTQIHSPIDGTVIARFAHEGESIESAGRIVTIANLEQTRLEAEVNEFDSDRVRVGLGAIVTAEGYPEKVWRAEVEEIPDAITGRQLKPQDAGRPSDTGVLLVKLKLLEPAPFKLGERVEVQMGPADSLPIADVR